MVFCVEETNYDGFFNEDVIRNDNFSIPYLEQIYRLYLERSMDEFPLFVIQLQTMKEFHNHTAYATMKVIIELFFRREERFFTYGLEMARNSPQTDRMCREILFVNDVKILMRNLENTKYCLQRMVNSFHDQGYVKGELTRKEVEQLLFPKDGGVAIINQTIDKFENVSEKLESSSHKMRLLMYVDLLGYLLKEYKNQQVKKFLKMQ